MIGNFSNNIIIFLSIAAALLFGAYLIRQQLTAGTRSSRVREQIAAQRGWTLRSAQTAQATWHNFGSGAADDFAWQIEGATHQTSDGPVPSEILYTRWLTNAVAAKRQVVAVGPGTAGLPTNVSREHMVSFLREMVVNSLPDASPQDRKRLKGLKEVPIGGGYDFSRWYLVFATSRSLARTLISDEVVAMLAAWADARHDIATHPTIIYWSNGLQIRISGDHTTDAALLDRLVALGKLLVAQLPASD